MPLQPPSFGSRQYWNDRFTSNSHPFEWLEAPTALDSHLVEALKESDVKNPEVLHIGCGTSLLSYHLRAHVKHPEQIHNLDYSEVAVEVGRRRESSIFNVEQCSEDQDDVDCTTSDEVDGKDTITPRNRNKLSTESLSISGSDEASSTACMRWSSANLLSHASLLNVCKPSTYSIIVDKSTSDSIACADDVYVPLPYRVNTSPGASSSQKSQSPEPVHPIDMLGIHLGLVAKPKARWISLSYSSDRFPFLDRTSFGDSVSGPKLASVGLESPDDDFEKDSDDIPQQMNHSGLPDPSPLWTLVGKHEIEVPQQDTKIGGMTSHRPKVLHWVYVLERTDVQVFVKDN